MWYSDHEVSKTPPYAADMPTRTRLTRRLVIDHGHMRSSLCRMR